MRSVLPILMILTGCLLGGGRAGAVLPVRISYLYSLSDFNGKVPFGDVILHVDRQHDEVYVVVGNSVRVFNNTGMEIYRFDHDLERGKIFGLVSEDSGDLVFLMWQVNKGVENRRWWLTRTDFRGHPIEDFEVTGLPEDLVEFGPNHLLYQQGRLILTSRSQLRVVEVDAQGNFERSWDLASLIELDNANAEMFGFSIDVAGNLLFTIATQFRAYVVSPEGQIRQWGTVGSAPGKFGIVSGIIADDHGNILIADKLRHVVMVFDSSLKFITEFAGAGTQDLVRPTEMRMGVDGKFYVTQARNQGVAVFRLTPNRLGIDSRSRPNGSSPQE